MARSLGGQGHDRVGALGDGLRPGAAVEVGRGVAGIGDADLKIVMLTAAPGTDDETKLKLAAIAPVP